jgi:hypothetical protein
MWRSCRQTDLSGPLQTNEYSRTNVIFAAKDGCQLDAWLYMPTAATDSSAKPPIVLMAHGEQLIG